MRPRRRTLHRSRAREPRALRTPCQPCRRHRAIALQGTAELGRATEEAKVTHCERAPQGMRLKTRMVFAGWFTFGGSRRGRRPPRTSLARPRAAARAKSAASPRARSARALVWPLAQVGEQTALGRVIDRNHLHLHDRGRKAGGHQHVPRSCMSTKRWTRAAPATPRSSFSVSGPSVLNMKSPCGASTRANSPNAAGRPSAAPCCTRRARRPRREWKALHVGAHRERLAKKSKGAPAKHGERKVERDHFSARIAFRQRALWRAASGIEDSARRASHNRVARACARPLRPRGATTCGSLAAARSKRRRTALRSSAGERSLNRSRDRENARVAHRRTAHHEADRRRARIVARQRRGAAVEEVHQPDDLEDAHIPPEVRLVARVHFVDRRRDARRRGQRKASNGASAPPLALKLGAQKPKIHVVCSGEILAEEHALRHARVVLREALGVLAMDGIGLGARVAAALEIFALTVERRQGFSMTSAPARRRRSSAIANASATSPSRASSASPFGTRKRNLRRQLGQRPHRFTGEDCVVSGAAGDRVRERPDGIERVGKRESSIARYTPAVGLKPVTPQTQPGCGPSRAYPSQAPSRTCRRPGPPPRPTTSRRAAGRSCGPRVFRRAVMRVDAGRAEGEFHHVGSSDEYRARAQARDRRSVFARFPLQHLRAGPCHVAGDVERSLIDTGRPSPASAARRSCAMSPRSQPAQRASRYTLIKARALRPPDRRCGQAPFR